MCKENYRLWSEANLAPFAEPLRRMHDRYVARSAVQEQGIGE